MRIRDKAYDPVSFSEPRACTPPLRRDPTQHGRRPADCAAVGSAGQRAVPRALARHGAASSPPRRPSCVPHQPVRPRPRVPHPARIRPLPRRAPTRAPRLLPRVRAPPSEAATIGTSYRPAAGRGRGGVSMWRSPCARGKTTREDRCTGARTTLGFLEAVRCSHQTPSPIHSDTLRCNTYLPSSTPAHPFPCPFNAARDGGRRRAPRQAGSF